MAVHSAESSLRKSLSDRNRACQSRELHRFSTPAAGSDLRPGRAQPRHRSSGAWPHARTSYARHRVDRPGRRRVTLSLHRPTPLTLSYDHLVIAMGTRLDYSKIPGMREHATAWRLSAMPCICAINSSGCSRRPRPKAILKSAAVCYVCRRRRGFRRRMYRRDE